MNFIELFKSYEGLKSATIIIAIFVALIDKLASRFIKQKVVKAIFPFALGIIAYFTYYAILFENPFSENVGGHITNGILCGSLSSVYGFIYNCFKENDLSKLSNLNPIKIAISDILSDVLPENAEYVAERIILETSTSDSDNNIDVISAILSEEFKEITEEDKITVTLLIAQILIPSDSDV